MVHLEKFGFEWEDTSLEFKYSVEFSTDKKMNKKFTKNLMEPSQGLINKGTGTEQTSSVPTRAHFFPERKASEDLRKNHKNVPVVCYVHQSYFLYVKSGLIKETFTTALNKKKILIYGSISYFNKKTENKIFRIITPEKFLKFYVDKDATKNP